MAWAARAVHPVPHLELRGPENSSPSGLDTISRAIPTARLFPGLLADEGRQALGFRFLFRGEMQF